MQDKIIPKSFLAFLLLCFGGDVNAVIVQKLDYEGCWESHCDTSCLISAACKDYSHNLALGRIDRAAAGTWPSSFIYDQFPRSIFVNRLPICGDISSRRERLHEAERKACESDWHSIQGLKNIESQWIDSRRYLTNLQTAKSRESSTLQSLNKSQFTSITMTFLRHPSRGIYIAMMQVFCFKSAMT